MGGDAKTVMDLLVECGKSCSAIISSAVCSNTVLNKMFYPTRVNAGPRQRSESRIKYVMEIPLLQTFPHAICFRTSWTTAGPLFRIQSRDLSHSRSHPFEGSTCIIKIKGNCFRSTALTRGVTRGRKRVDNVPSDRRRARKTRNCRNLFSTVESQAQPIK